jgi:hypothetical protein
MELMQNVTAAEVTALAEILQGVRSGSRITVAIDGDVGRLLHGVMRHLAPESGSAAHGSWNMNLWDLSVRVSATMEHWFTVRALVNGLADGTVAIKH